MRILILLLPIVYILYFIMSIVLYNKRKTILEHYNNIFGYISSFIFASFMFAPLPTGMTMYMFENEGKAFAPLTLIYCIPGLIWYFIKRKQCPKTQRAGLFWAMLGMGLCAPMFLVYYCIVGFVKGASTSSSSGSYSYSSESTSSNNNAHITNSSGSTSGYYYSSNGRLTDQTGNTTGYYNPESGRLTNASGTTIGYVDKNSGRISDEHGRLKGYIDTNSGRISDECGNLQGYTQ